MKKFVKILILLVVAAAVFLTGAGVTIINYCCTSCSGQTLFMTEKHTCCTDTHHTHDKKSCCASSANNESVDSCEDLVYTDLSHCTASRLSIDIDASSFRPHISIPFVWLSDAAVYLPESFIIDNEVVRKFNVGYKAPPDIPPRKYLSLIQILII